MRKLQGTIISNKTSKTVVVNVERLKRHSKYLKYFKVSRRFKAHVENEKDYQIGDLVVIQETRPMSKDKRWRVTRVVKKAVATETLEDAG